MNDRLGLGDEGPDFYRVDTSPGWYYQLDKG